MKRKAKKSDIILLYLCILCGAFTILVLFFILFHILFNGISHVSFEFLSTPFKGKYTGIYPMIISTIYIIITTLIIAVPIGIFCAIYLTEYIKDGFFVKIIRFSIRCLTGIPSIIYGLFGLIFFVTTIKLQYSILAGALTLSIMVLPTIITTTEEALRTVPMTYKEASLALGATRVTTIFKIILPCAMPGILTAVILSIGRIVGETAAVYLTAGMAKNIPASIMQSGRTLAVHLYYLANEGISMDQSYATGTVLIITIAILNFLALMVAKVFTKNSKQK